MSPLRRIVPSIIAAASLLLAGCSSTSKSVASARASTTTQPVSTSPVQAAPTTTGATTVPATSTSAGVSTDTGSADGSAADPATTGTSTGGGAAPAEPAVCASVAQVYGAIINATLPILQGKTGPEPFDADALSRALDVHTMGTLPAELAPDFAAFTTAAEQLRGKDLTAAAALLNGPEITKATNDIDKYTSDRC